ncbi:MAG: zinc ribbon domain-containing protein YjdM [Desulfuromonadaceae bacterium]|nr:zinc ribbon domain-containing protein YjdM [Desulfuromonadaceae bacterium]
MSDMPNCPKCNGTYTYQDRDLYVCPECAHEWQDSPAAADTSSPLNVRDAHGNQLQDGDSISVIKDLKIKGSSAVVKVGTKVKNIRLLEGDHNIDCKIDGIGAMQLKSEFVKKI